MARPPQDHADCRKCGARFPQAAWLKIQGVWHIVAAKPERETRYRNGVPKSVRVPSEPLQILHNTGTCEAIPAPTPSPETPTPTPQNPKETPMQNPAPALSLDALLGAAVQQHTAALAAELAELRAELAKKDGRKPVQIHIPPMPPLEFDSTEHYLLPRVAALLNLAKVTRVWPYLHGGPGTGKSYAPGVIAQKMGLRVLRITLGPATLPSQLFGYFDASGKFVATPLYHAWKDGETLIVWEELDNTNPAVLTLLNGGFANDVLTFACGDIPRHETCLMIANGNTTLRGGTKGHESRQKLDSASLDRFAFVHFPSDREQEEARIKPILNGKTAAFMDWTEKVREHIKAHRPDIVSSQRGGFAMALTIANTPASIMPNDEILETYLFRGIDPAVKDAILKACPVPRSLFEGRK